MDTVLLAQLAKLGALPTIMGVVIFVQWRQMNTLRDKWQEKYDAMIVKTIETISASANQTNVFNMSLTTLITMITKQGDNWHGFKDELIGIVREAAKK